MNEIEMLGEEIERLRQLVLSQSKRCEALTSSCDRLLAERNRAVSGEYRANQLADVCGTLRAENDQLLLENAKLRRKLGL